ncbi:MAG TPA: acyltransferase [Mucilaginibacter sp.]|jgi:peptidoglycan/LPS O-acetylase OafA/YrhL|nr:acyltransferase [Mucilaginibacter sp.]
MPKTEKIHSVVYLRAIAALGVCIIHIQFATGVTFNKIVDYFINSGQQGVAVFFVISGFILPTSLYRSGYQLKNFFRFIAKRSLRVDPPYWFSIILLFTIGLYPAKALHIDRLLYHLTYLVPFVKGQEWFTGVYWTLSIEFQFYLILALLFPLLIKGPKYVSIAVLIAISLFCLRYTVRGFIISYVYDFAFGFLAFFAYTKIVNMRPFIIILVGFTVAICCFKSIASGLVPFLTVLTIVFMKTSKPVPVLSFLGNISYSIYLIHIPVMTFLGHQLSIYHLSPLALSVIFIATIIPAAYLMFYLVEKPSMLLSKRIKLKPVIQ